MSSPSRATLWRRANPDKEKAWRVKNYTKNKTRILNQQSTRRKIDSNYRGGNNLNYMNSTRGWVTYKLSSIKNTCQKRNHQFGLVREDLEKLIVTHCPVLGVKLDYSLNRGHKLKMHPNSPSVDRINNDLGYISGNIIIVSALVNRVKSNLSLEELPIVLQKIIVFYERFK